MKHTGSGSHTARATLGRLGVGALSIVFALSQVLGLLGTAVPSAWAEAAAEPETVTVTPAPASTASSPSQARTPRATRSRSTGART